MPTLTASSVAKRYADYLNQRHLTLNNDSVLLLSEWVNEATIEQPETALDFNNVAVMALIEAEQSDDATLRVMNVQFAIEALNQGAQMQPSHPLCAAHLALVYGMMGDASEAAEIAFATLLESAQSAYVSGNEFAPGLVYLSPRHAQEPLASYELLQTLLKAENGSIQAQCLLADTLYHLQLAFYNGGGLRFLKLATSLMPDSATYAIKLGLANLINKQWEGLVHLHQAQILQPNYAPALQALYLAYRNFGQIERANFWHHSAQAIAQSSSSAGMGWRWTELPSDSTLTYIPFDHGVLLAVDAHFQSLVTSVLLAEQDWFEAEIEFWRSQLQPGMTVIDVGANVGVYTFSAAMQVGAEGRVLAVEPFSGCVQCMQETCRINDVPQVTVCAGAASDRNGTAQLSLHSSSELNELVTDATAATSGGTETVDCFTLDSLFEREQLERVDWLKIDAEGHEMQVLRGSDRILTEFAPGILYENIAGSSGSNTPVADYLQSRGYRLFRYRSFIGELVPIESMDELQGKLNVIALPIDRVRE